MYECGLTTREAAAPVSPGMHEVQAGTHVRAVAAKNRTNPARTVEQQIEQSVIQLDSEVIAEIASDRKQQLGHDARPASAHASNDDRPYRSSTSHF